MKKIAIAGISGNTDNYRNALSQLGAVCTTLTDVSSSSQFDALLLPGGGDIDPVLFGETDHGSRSIDPVLDRQQLSMLDAFVSAGKPILGICKGMQVINIYFGGRIIQDLPTNTLHQYTDRDQVHPSHALPGTVLQKLYGSDFPVNSAHHQGIGSPGRDLFIIQYALNTTGRILPTEAFFSLTSCPLFPENLLPAGIQQKRQRRFPSLPAFPFPFYCCIITSSQSLMPI